MPHYATTELKSDASTVQASNHAQFRWLQRADAPARSLPAAWMRGVPCTVDGRDDIDEARYVAPVAWNSTPVVLLRRGQVIVTVLIAMHESVSFTVGGAPTLRCTCGVERPNAVSNRSCACCESQCWRVVDDA